MPRKHLFLIAIMTGLFLVSAPFKIDAKDVKGVELQKNAKIQNSTQTKKDAQPQTPATQIKKDAQPQTPTTQTKKDVQPAKPIQDKKDTLIQKPVENKKDTPIQKPIEKDAGSGSKFRDAVQHQGPNIRLNQLPPGARPAGSNVDKALPVGMKPISGKDISTWKNLRNSGQFRLVVAGRSTFDLIEKDLKEGVITAPEYFLQKLSFVSGSSQLYERYRQNADPSADALNNCGTTVISEMEQYLNDPNTNPKAVAGINAFFSPLVLKSEEGTTYPPEPNYNVIGCDNNPNWCKFPSRETRWAINSHSVEFPPAGSFQEDVNNFIEERLKIFTKAVNVDSCVCAHADGGNVVEVYYDRNTPNADYTATLIANYLETPLVLAGDKKPWVAIRDNTYVIPTPDPNPILDMSKRPGPTRRWQIADTSGAGRPYQIYVTPSGSALGLMHHVGTDSGGSVIFIKTRSPVDDVITSVEGRSQIPYTITSDNMLKGSLIHELFHVFYGKLLWGGGTRGYKKDLYEEGLASAIVNTIDLEANEEFYHDADFLDNHVGDNIYEMTGRKAYPLSLLFRYIAALSEESVEEVYPFRQYILNTLSQGAAGSKQILHDDYLSNYFARFAASNLNIDGYFPFDHIFKYSMYDDKYPEHFSVPHKFIYTRQDEFTCEAKEVGFKKVEPGRANYQLVAIKGERKNNRFIRIDHSRFTGNPGTQLGVMLIHVDGAIPGDSTDFDKYILGDNGTRTINYAKYYEYKNGDPPAEICIETESERPNLMLFILANSSQTNTAASGNFRVSICTTCDPIGSGLAVRASNHCEGFYPHEDGTTSKIEERYSDSYTIRNMVLEEEHIIHGNNTALGSKDGILAHFWLTKANIDIDTRNWERITDPPHPDLCPVDKIINQWSEKIDAHGFSLDEYTRVSTQESSGQWHPVAGRLTLYKDGNYTFTLQLTVGVGQGREEWFSNCPSYSSSSSSNPSWTSLIIHRIHGRFENGATNLSGIATLPHIITHKLLMSIFSTPGPVCGMDRLVAKVGEAHVSWGIDIPMMWHVARGPNDPVPTPPRYWELPPFCEVGTDSYDIRKCGIWSAQVFWDDPTFDYSGPDF